MTDTNISTYTCNSKHSDQSPKSSTGRACDTECTMIMRTQNFNPEAGQSQDNGRNTAMFSVLTKARKTATALQKDFQQERIFFFLCIPDN